MLNFLLEGEAPATDNGIWTTIIMIAVLFIFLYFFMIRPQKKQERRDAEMRDALAVGDEVTTIGGIIGKVVSIKGETFVLETTKEKTKIRFLKAAVRSVDVKIADVVAASAAAEAEQKAEQNVEEAPAPDAVDKNSEENK